ncbi:DUF7144 family membrane protein [Actinacidiphila soli]|jgi:hypothetical protein|uniref:DUF7144 family membrane protein n=1 Tax=Actinacidiphila soli TaxID=2487275 RepID=UPI000FCC7AE7|nr:hypothetical protein [Actinacidiphila soli]
MTTTTPHRADRVGGSPWAAGGTVFAGVLLLVDGVLAILQGISGIARNDVYALVGNYAFKFDLASWGWVHLGLGIVLVLTGMGVLGGSPMARYVGVALAGLSVLANFLFLPYSPVWSVVLIAMGVFIIWSLCTYRPGRTA